MNNQLTNFYEEFERKDGVFYLGHASILVILNGKKILFDPIIVSQPYGDSWVFFPPQVADRRFYDVDAVVVSHIHQDHYDLEFLKKINSSVKIIIVGNRPSFETDIVSNSGKEITIIKPETVTEIFSGIYIYGVTHETNGIDSSAILYNDKLCIYHGNDNYLQPASMAKFTKINAQIDVACIPYAYIHWYPFLMEYAPDKLEEKEAEGARLVNMYMNDCLNTIRILNPKVVIPFGANLLIDDGNAYSEINLAVKTPIEFMAHAQEQLSQYQHVVQPMLAGDFCGNTASGFQVTISHSYGAEEYRATAHTFLQGRPKKSVNDEWQTVDIQKFLGTLNRKLSDVEGSIDNVVRIELDYLNEIWKIEIDCKIYRASLVSQFDLDRPYHHFKLDQISSGEWLNGKRFEEIIGMRRFTLKREPNLYLPDILKLVNTVI
jgi:L-ascorbate metabolism protein UlaG (beta-lactamase superfamily)